MVAPTWLSFFQVLNTAELPFLYVRSGEMISVLMPPRKLLS